MSAGATPAHFSNVVAFLATAGVVVPLFKRLKVSPVLGFLTAGVVLGPQVLGRLVSRFPLLDYFTVTQPTQIADLAELGVVFLLFMIGLELSWERLRLMRRLVFGLGALQVVVCATLVGAIAMACGLSINAAIAIGAALALSSTAIAVPVLTEGGRLHSGSGRAAFAILLFQDLAVAPILIALAVIGRSGQASAGGGLVTLGTAAVGLVVIVVGGRLLLRPLFRSAARAKSQELFMAASLLVVIGAGLIAQLLGLSMALGAFIAGILLAETEYRHQVEVMIEPFKGLLLGLFFLSIGVGLDLNLLAAEPLFIVGVAAGLIAVKAAAIFGLSRLFGLKSPQALEAALLLGSGGEFAFVVLNQAAGAGVIDHETAQALLVSATLSLFALPALGALGSRLAKSAEPSAARAPAPPPPDEQPRVLVVGYGRVGRLVGDMLSAHKLDWLAVERDARLVEPARHNGEPVWFGDAASPEMLDKLGLGHAPALVVTMDSPEVVEAVTATARRMRPELVIVARARDARQARKLYDLGATDAVPETIEASLQLSEAVLVHIGVPMGLVIASIHEKRDQIRAQLNLPLPAPSRLRRRPAP